MLSKRGLLRGRRPGGPLSSFQFGGCLGTTVKAREPQNEEEEEEEDVLGGPLV